MKFILYDTKHSLYYIRQVAFLDLKYAPNLTGNVAKDFLGDRFAYLCM